MKRITLTGVAARLLETQMTAYEDQQDPQTRKFLRDSKERRQWARIAESFDDVPNPFDALARKHIAEGNEWGSDFQVAQAKRIAALQERWEEAGVGPEIVSSATTALQALATMQTNGKQFEVNTAINQAQDDPEVGGRLIEIDVDDTGADGGVAFLAKTWEIIAGTVLASDPDTRRHVKYVTNALRNAVELVREGDLYVPKQITKPTLVEKEMTG